MLVTLNAARIATVPVPLKFTQAFAVPLATVAIGTEFDPDASESVFARSVLMLFFQRKMATYTPGTSNAFDPYVPVLMRRLLVARVL